MELTQTKLTRADRRENWCKNCYDTAFCDEELKFGAVIDNATPSKTAHRAQYHNHVIQGILCFSLIVWPQNKNCQF